MILSLKELGKRCKKFRMEQGFFQSHVAEETGYSIENISSFENGRNDNSQILLWYFSHGMDFKYLVTGGCDNGETV